MTIRTVLPRIEIRKNDQKPDQYPTVARTGNKQLGTSKRFFDDTKTVVYQNNVLISYPTTLQVGSNRIESDLTSTLQAIGNTSPNTSEQFNEYPEAFVENPFSEGFGDLEQSSQDPFFLTGTSLSDLGYYFNSKLADKTKIVIEVPISSELVFLSQSIACYYYNKDTNSFDTIRQSRGEVFGSDFITLTSDITPDSTIFDPFGKYSVKPEPGDISFTNLSLKNNYFFANPSGSFLVSASSNPTVSNLISMDSYLNQPFLVEKAILEVPLEAGPGWLNDQTKYGVTTDTGMTVSPIFDVGGPAITFGLLNYHGGNVKSIIMSGSLIPAADATAYLSESYVRELPGNTGSFYTHPAGFRFFGKEAGIINSTTFFTGTAVFKMNSQTSVGFRSVDTLPFKNYNSFRSFVSSRVQGLDIIGRTKQGDINNIVGRSLYGKDVSPPEYSKGNIQPTRLDLWEAYSYPGAGQNTIVQYQIEKYTNSPYLLYPKDTVFFSLNKYRPAWNSSSYTGVGEYSGRQYYSSKSHDVKIPTGILRLTLYGSLVREDKEFHETSNQQLDSAEIHEFIGAEPIVDQFDLFYPQEFSGSYIDRFRLGDYIPFNSITGTLERERLQSNFATPNNISIQTLTGSNAYIRTRKQYEYAQNFKNVQLISKNERFYDSIHPKLTDLFQQPQSNNTAAYIFLAAPRGDNTSDKYGMGYLFSGQFAYAGRSLFDKETFPMILQSAGIDFKEYSYDKLGIIFYNGNLGFQNGNFWYEDISPPSTLYQKGVGEINEAKRILFGFGKMRGNGINGGVVPRQKYFNGGFYYSSIGAELSGWKYGLISAIPTFSKAIFRRDHFGQPRDMLEQRIDTKFYDTIGFFDDGSPGGIQGQKLGPVQVKFVDSNGNLTDPAKTWSNNLSTEVTSSLPYFDGEARSREEPIDVSNLNSSNVTILL